MTNPLFPLLDGLAKMGQTRLDHAAEMTWTEIEHLEIEHGSLDAQLIRKSGGTEWKTNRSVSGLSDAERRMQPLRSTTMEAPHLGDATEGTALDLMSLNALEPAEVSMYCRSTFGLADANTGAISTRAHEDSQAETLAAPVPAVSKDSGSGQSIAASAASIKHSLASSGAFIAAQTLLAAVRALAPEQVSALLDEAAGTIVAMFEQMIKLESGDSRIQEQQRQVRVALSLAHISTAIDADPRHPASLRLLRDLCAIALVLAPSNDNATFSGLAQALGIGAGARLALAVAADLADHDEGLSRAPALITLILASFTSLGDRIDETYTEVLKLTGPLCLEWHKWSSESEESAVRALVNALKGKPGYLDAMAYQLERLESVGLSAFRTVRELAAYSCDRNFCDVHERFLANPNVFASIAGSRAALRDIRHVSLTRNGEQDGPVVDAVLLTLTQIGFDAPRAAFLAEISKLGRSALLLEGNWTELNDIEFMEVQGSAFQRLLAFLNGQYVVTEPWETIGFDDADMLVQSGRGE